MGALNVERTSIEFDLSNYFSVALFLTRFYTINLSERLTPCEQDKITI